MKKIIVCMLLVMTALLALTLAGCSNGSGDISESSRTAKTLTMWIITEDETTAAAQAEVEAAFNEITESDYTTHVDLIFCTADEYKAALEAQFNKIANKPSSEKAPVVLKNATYRDEETGMLRVLYPDVWEYQMDIVLITDQQMLNDYVKKGRLTNLTTNISSTGSNKIIRTYVDSSILDNAKVDGSWYAIPNNNMIGNYTFMLVNKALAEKYYFKSSDFSSFGMGTAAANLIEEIAANEDMSKVAPMYGMANYPLAKYWSQNGDNASVLATIYSSADVQIGNYAPATNLFDNEGYKSFMQQMYYCKEQGYFADAENPQDVFGVAVMEGDYSIYQQYGQDYHIIPLAYPRMEDTDIFDSMFAVSSSTIDVGRSMEIIQALTCESELRNVLQYGVEGVHYELDDDGVVKRLNHNYMMNINYTGNVFKAYPEEGMPANMWQEIAIEQNKAAMLSIVFGTTECMDTLNRTAWQQMSDVSISYFERLAKCETVSEFNAFLNVAKNEILASDYYTALCTMKYETIQVANAAEANQYKLVTEYIYKSDGKTIDAVRVPVSLNAILHAWWSAGQS